MRINFLLIALCASYLQANTTQQVFTDIYANKIWGTNDEGLGWSGIGSSLQATIAYREFIENFLRDYSIKTVVDLGCGDWEFSRFINWANINYLGIDIVRQVVERNIEKYQTDTIHFMHADALGYDMPSADLLICKEVLQHLSNKEIFAICSQFRKYKYCLITNGIDYETLTSENREISCGDYRPLDLTAPPFNIPGIKILTFYSAGFLKQTLLITN